MFGNREFSIRMSKPDKGNGNDEPRNKATIFEDRIAIVHTIISDGAKKAFLGVCAYVVLDTFRQVLVARNTKH